MKATSVASLAGALEHRTAFLHGLPGGWIADVHACLGQAGEPPPAIGFTGRRIWKVLQPLLAHALGQSSCASSKLSAAVVSADPI